MKYLFMFIVPLIMLIMVWMIGLGLFVVFTLGIQPSLVSQKADGIIVLTGGRGRIDTALNLLIEGHGEKLLISGVHQQTPFDDILDNAQTLDEQSKQALRNHCCITLGYYAGNTNGNATEAAIWADRENVSRIRLITSDYHILRARLEFQRQMPNRTIIMHAVRPERENPIDIELLRIMHKEYNKFLAISVLYFKERIQSNVVKHKAGVQHTFDHVQEYLMNIKGTASSTFQRHTHDGEEQ